MPSTNLDFTFSRNLVKRCLQKVVQRTVDLLRKSKIFSMKTTTSLSRMFLLSLQLCSMTKMMTRSSRRPTSMRMTSTLTTPIKIWTTTSRLASRNPDFNPQDHQLQTILFHFCDTFVTSGACHHVHRLITTLKYHKRNLIWSSIIERITPTRRRLKSELHKKNIFALLLIFYL